MDFTYFGQFFFFSIPIKLLVLLHILDFNMGINNGISIFTKIIPECYPQRGRKYGIVFDGNIYLYSGLTNLNNNISENNITCSRNAYSKITSNISYLQQVLGDDITIKIYFDGKAPVLKMPTQVKRRENFKHNCNMNIVKLELIKLLENTDHNGKPAYIVINDAIGEGESNMFFERDVTKPTILVTQDSDIFNIILNYKPQNESDQVYIYLPNKKTFYDINAYELLLKPCALKLLAILSGSDFNDSILTQSMINKILEVASTAYYDGNFPDEITINNIESVIAEFIRLCMLPEPAVRLVFPATQISLNVFLSNEDVTKRLDWVYRYMSQGREIEDYDEPGKLGSINRNEYLVYCYNKTFNTSITTLHELKVKKTGTKRKAKDQSEKKTTKPKDSSKKDSSNTPKKIKDPSKPPRKPRVTKDPSKSPAKKSKINQIEDVDKYLLDLQNLLNDELVEDDVFTTVSQE